MFLDRIVAQTRIDLEQRKRELPLEELQRRAAAQPPARDLAQALTSHTGVHLIAEVKRASPSKGLLAPDLDPVATARLYAANGAAAISVLTEPHFFLGAPEFLMAIKQEVSVPVLRKDFIIDEYQVYEARSWGADAILLICAILDDRQLRHLLNVAHSLGMRCLVEVHSREEALRATSAGALVLGVNSRDLVTFKMNPYLIRDLRQLLPADRILVAESGIHTPADARRLARYDVQAMLVGESLVIAPDIAAQMHMLLHAANESTQVKICGLREPEHIDAAVEAGADLLGIIFYPPSHRYLSPQQVRGVFQQSQRYSNPAAGTTSPDLVGIFVNEGTDFINAVIEEAGLHFVQLSGTETPEFCQQINRPVIKGLQLRGPNDLAQIERYADVTWRILLDTPAQDWGGTGKTHDWELAHKVAQQQRMILAGGLTPENVAVAIQQVYPWGIDVSSGVETNKQKDPAKIRSFIQNVRTYQQLAIQKV